MSDKLKQCPYCGHEPNSYRYDYSSVPFPDIEYTVECRNSECPVKPRVVRGTDYEATEAWNTRAEQTCVMKSIKHGPMYDIFQCTNCGTEFAERNSEVYIDYKYCPYCGAKVVA